MSSSSYRFILIDDVPVNNLLARITIESVFPDASIIEFTEGEAGFAFIEQECSNGASRYNLFLDIYMPVMDGWDFMEKFNQLDSSIKNNVKVYALSSSISRIDEDRAKLDSSIAAYLIKPFTQEILKSLDLIQ